MKKIIPLIFSFLCLTTMAQPGSLDLTFGTEGKVITPIGNQSDYGQAVAVQDDGKIVLAGYYSKTQNNYDFAVVRYNSNGTLDTTFGFGGKVTTDFNGHRDEAFSVALQNDGKIIIAGYAILDSVWVIALVRYTNNGNLDTTFGLGGKATTHIDYTAQGKSIAIQGDGKLIVTGFVSYFVNNVGYEKIVLVRYNNDGNLDTTFGNAGIVTTAVAGYSDFGNAVTIQSDGKIIVAGSSYMGTYPNEDFTLVRYDNNGNLDSSFGAGGKVTTDFGACDGASSIAIQNSGKILVVGAAAGYCYSGSRFALACYNSSGSLDSSFGSNGKVVTGIGSGGIGWTAEAAAMSVAIQYDGKIVVGGRSTINSEFDFAIVRYNPDGSYDNTFGAGGIVTTDFNGYSEWGYSLAIQPDGKIILAGNVGNNTDCDFGLARYNGDAVGMKDNPDLFVADIFPNPSTGIFTVQIHNCPPSTKLIVHDVLGNRLLEQNCLDGIRQEINLSCQPKGVYFLEIVSASKRTVRKIALH